MTLLRALQALATATFGRSRLGPGSSLLSMQVSQGLVSASSWHGFHDMLWHLKSQL